MKATGIVRQVDDLGRLVIPKEIRNTYDIAPGDNLEIFTEGDTIILRKYQPADIFTGEMEDLVDYNGKKVSKASIRKLAELAGMKISE
ncbi:MAG: AbrB/MazE/SpoVT family DNA-binding domain-containing protein [Firmicutes bacterium]|nr:AbrB/MazE/SpoVT family DNA-binding domain-containing protein [Bacillota bacterium]